jgi:hypothetical protein
MIKRHTALQCGPIPTPTTLPVPAPGLPVNTWCRDGFNTHAHHSESGFIAHYSIGGTHYSTYSVGLIHIIV